MALKLEKYSKDLELESEVKTLLLKGKTEKDIIILLRDKNIPDSRIVEAIANVSSNSNIVSSYCDEVLVPKVKELLKCKITVGEVAERLYANSYPKILVDEALCKVLSELYLVD